MNRDRSPEPTQLQLPQLAQSQKQSKIILGNTNKYDSNNPSSPREKGSNGNIKQFNHSSKLTGGGSLNKIKSNAIKYQVGEHYLSGAKNASMLSQSHFSQMDNILGPNKQQQLNDPNIKMNLSENDNMANLDKEILQKFAQNLLVNPQANFYEMAPNHIRQFYNNRRDFKHIFEDYDKVQYCLEEVTTRVKCYRYGLGNLIEKVGENFKIIVDKMLESTIKLFNECRQKSEREMKENIQIIEKLEREKKELEQKNRNLRKLYNFQESEYKICKINADALENEVSLLRDLLRKDVQSIIQHLECLESVNKKGTSQAKDDPSDSLVNGLSSLNKFISDLEERFVDNGENLGRMNNLLKAMLKGNKHDTYTQVDEGELLWKPDQVIYQNAKEKVDPNINDVEASTINLDKHYDHTLDNKSNIEIMKMKEKELEDKIPLAQGENWNLPISIIVFLENITKSTESGRVVPWLYFKKIVNDIYVDRIKCNQEIAGSLCNTSINFDEFVCLWFLQTHKLRRLAEIKLLEFLVSLKYYSKIWPRALMFAQMCGIIQYKPANPEPNFSYQFDLYLQNFFLFCYAKTIISPKVFYDSNEGNTLVYKDKVDDLCRDMLVFCGGQNLKKFVTKLMKSSRKFTIDKGTEKEETHEFVDFDKVLEASMEEYWEVKKRNFKQLQKSFSKLYESDHGLFSFDDVKQIVSEVLNVESPLENYSYAKELTTSRAFLFSLTSSKNKFDINTKEFIFACQRFGIDCPFPFISMKGASFVSIKQASAFGGGMRRGAITGEGEAKSQQQEQKDNAAGGASQSSINGDQLQQMRTDTIQTEDDKEKQNLAEGGGQSKKKLQAPIQMDSSSSLFAQHFSILRELRSYCIQFRESVKSESEPEVIWKHFDNIMNILEAGTQFLNFPINI